MTDIRIRLNQINADSIATSVFASKSDVNLVQDNVAALDNNVWVNANDYTTYSTLSGLINTVQSNVDALPDSAANDYATYNTLSSSIDTVQANLTSLVGAAPSTLDTLAEIAAALENDANLAVTLTTSIGSVQSNVTTLTSTTAANDYATYTTLSGLIDTVQDNVASAGGGSGNTTLYVGDTAIANSAIIVEAGSGISLSGNSTAHTLSISASMSNASAQVIPVDGSSNSFSTIKAAANNNMVLVIYNGIVQDHTKYSWSDTDLTLANTDPLTAGSNVEVRYFDFFDLPGVSEGGGGGYTFQGTVSGYSSGGTGPVNIIDKFSFTSDGNATDVGDLTEARFFTTGQSSSESGYTSGGRNPADVNTIDKFPFATDGNATDVGDLTLVRDSPSGQSSSTSGYTSGGENRNVIDKFPFATDANATDVGDLLEKNRAPAGQSSSDNGYVSAGYYLPVGFFNTIQKFPFSSDANASDVGDLTQARLGPAGQSSSTSGYSSGGSSPTVNIIDKFPFASDGNATDVGDLTQSRDITGDGQSSTASGYTSGGNAAPPVVNTIDKFPFSSDSNATDVGDLTQARQGPAGQQV